jgi:hypothetical protein
MKKVNPAEANAPSNDPAQSASEEHGKIKGRQLTDRTMPENDIARGAEGGAGRGGTGGQQAG